MMSITNGRSECPCGMENFEIENPVRVVVPNKAIIRKADYETDDGWNISVTETVVIY